MLETPLPPDDELQHLRERVRKLAQEKSYLQLIIQLMNRLSGAPGLEDTIESMLRCVLDLIGGSNIELYYAVDTDLRYADVFGTRRKIETIEDAAVKGVFETRSPVEIERDFSESRMATPELTKAFTLVFPLVVGPDLIGVIKIQNVLIEMRALADHMPVFLDYTAAILKNEILGHIRLKLANDQLGRSNAELSLEVAQRTHAEEALRKANEELEARVVERTASWRAANEQLQIELTERKRAEDALKKSEERLRLEVARMPIGNIVWDKEFRVVTWNPAAEEIFGFTFDEAEGRHPYEIIVPPEAQPHVDDIWRRLLTGDTSAHSVNENQTRDGRTIVCEWTNTPLKQPNGTVLGVMSMVQDITERVRAEEALRAERGLFVGGPTVVFKWKAQEGWPVEYVSPNVADQFGYAPEEFTSGKVLYAAIVHPDDLARVDAEVSAHSEQGVASFEQMYRIARPDGRYRWIDDFTTVIRGRDGAITHYLGYVLDITERVRAEQEILRLDRTYRVLSQTNQMIIRARDRHEIFEEACRIAVDSGSFAMAWVGVVDEKTHLVRPVTSHGDVATYLETARISANDVPEGRGPTGTAMREGRHVICRDIERDPSMEPWRKAALAMGYRSCAAFPIHTGGKTVAAFSVYSHEADWFSEEETRLLDELASDISYAVESLEKETMRLLAEQALRESEERFRSFVERAVVGIYRSTPDGRFLMANAALARMLGFPSVEALLAENIDNWASRSGYDRTVFKELLEREGTATDFHGTYTAAGGATISLRESARAIRDERGEISYYEGIIEDMTAQKALEAQLLQSQKMETVGLLTGGIAHDFNNVLQALLNLSEVLRLRMDQPARFAATAADLQGQIKRGAALTRQLLLFSRREEPRLDRLDLNDLVQRLAKMIQRLLRENILLSLDLADEPIPLKADGGQLEQVLMNLALNAADAMPAGGQLVIRTRLDNADATMEVIDTGTGIAEEIRARIFEPFYTTKAASKGTGLGLAVVHGIIANHGGRIDVESEVGRGSTFRVVLPAFVVAEGGPAATAPEKCEELAEGTGERILLVEDEEGVREGLTEMLTMLGYEVTAVGSRAEAIAVPSHPGFDLLLTDLILPDVTGTDLAKELQHCWPELRILLMSGYSDDEELRQQISRDELGFIQKPFDSYTLARALRAALDERPKSTTARS